VIKLGDGPGAEHITFNPDTIIGAAFEDAFGGQLEVYHDVAAEQAAAAAQREVADANAAASAAMAAAQQPPAPPAEQPVPMADAPSSSDQP
jgi:hypothetical protein